MNAKKKHNKKRTIIALIASIILITLFSSIAYSAIASTMTVDGSAYARIEADVRITDFKLYETSNSISSYEEFTKNTVSSSISISNSGYVIYEIEITNYGEKGNAISNITGLPNGLTYELINYNLNDGICDNSGNCGTFAKKTFYIKIYGNNINTDFTLEFSFSLFHKFNYSEFKGTYPLGIIDGGSISIDLSLDSPKFVGVEAKQIEDYNYSNNVLTLQNVYSDVEIIAINNFVYNYSHSGTYKTFEAPATGMYKVELWGASGGYSVAESTEKSGAVGLGAYTSGSIELQKGEKLYVYVGGKGSDAKIGVNGTGGYNGGGNSTWDQKDNESAGAGGGATDIRTISGEWNNFNSLKSRLMVAAGGGGNSWNLEAHASSGGGLETNVFGRLITYNANGQQTITSTVPNTTQTKGYLFGIGQNGEGVGQFSDGSPGAGGGYYGGKVSFQETLYDITAGGSSFISGHNGCNAIDASSTEENIIHSGQSIHYSGKKFYNTTMIDGEGYNWTTIKATTKTGMPKYSETGTMTGNEGDGYAKITLISTKIEYDITYTNIVGTYKQKIKKNNTLIVDFSVNAPNMIVVYKDGNRTNEFTYQDGVLTINNIENNIEIRGIQETYAYDYTQSYQTFNVPYTGIYKIELWGASGGRALASGLAQSGQPGLGAYTKGTISLEENQKLYIYVGGKGKDGVQGVHGQGGYNGGGNGSWDGIDDESAGSGGGATDIRLVSGNWNDFASLKSRIMVAAGGGGVSWIAQNYPGGGGGITTDTYGRTIYTDETKTDFITSTVSNTTQTTGNAFGIGQNGSGVGNANDGSPGAGGGYYGGKVSLKETKLDIAAGGSSFISGHNGCNAIHTNSTETNIIHTGQSVHYSNYLFTNTIMVDGEGYNWTTTKGNYTGMPNYTGSSTMMGNDGNGYAKITLIELI